MAFGELLTVDQVRNQDHAPGEDTHHRRHGGHHGERLHDAATGVQHDQAEQQHHGGQVQGVRGHTVLGELAQCGGCGTVVRQAVHHAGGRENTGVRRGRRGGQHHKVHQRGGNSNARQGEHTHEGAHGLIQLVPGGDSEDGQQRQGVEEANAEGYRINCLGQSAFGVFGFRHGGTDQLSAHEGEERNLEGTQEARQALGKDTATGGAGAIPEICHGGDGTVGRGEAKGNHERTNNNEGDNRDDFNDCEPEFDFTEVLHRGQVQQQQSHDNGQRRDEGWDFRPPVFDVAGNGNDVRDTCDDPEEPVRPADKEAGAQAEDVGDEVGEGLVFGVGEQNLAHGAQNKVDDTTDNGVDKDDGGAGQGDGLCRAEEKAGADGAANSDQLDVSVA